MNKESNDTNSTEQVQSTSSSYKQVDTPPKSPTPPRGPRIWIIAIAIIAITFGFIGGSYWGPAVLARVISAMNTSTDEHTHIEGEEDASAKVFYTCGMHPWVILPDPGQCPICHMDLTPLDPDKFSGEISIDPVVTQNIGVRVEPVLSGPVVRTIRTVGTVEYDETRVRDVNIKVPGWIEKLFVGYVGEEVHEGDPLFEFYSPKLYSAQSEYLSALKMQGKIGVDFLPETEIDAKRLIDDARVQLEFYDITPKQIGVLEETGEPTKTMTIRSPHSGVVIAKHANEGMRVDPGMRVYQIADLSKIWVMVSLYEYQLPFVQVGQQTTMRLPYIPGQVFEGRVIYIYPYLNEKSRQIQVRLEFDNPDLMLKPGMYTSVEIKSVVARESTLAPRSAVIDTGKRSVAFVSLGEGKFEPRDVVMGVETDEGLVEIIDGLQPGELVVTSGQFLLDSESNIRESLAKMIRGDLASEQEAVVHAEGASEIALLPDAVSEEINNLLHQYFIVGDLLASDVLENTENPLREIAKAIDVLQKLELPNDPKFWSQHNEVEIVRNKAIKIASMTDISNARLAFADLSIALSKFVKATGIPQSFDREVQELHCPMYRGDQGGSIWLQLAGDVRNPFYGSSMLKCSDSRIAIPVTGQSDGEDSSPSTDAGSSTTHDGMDMNGDMQ